MMRPFQPSTEVQDMTTTVDHWRELAVQLPHNPAGDALFRRIYTAVAPPRQRHAVETISLSAGELALIRETNQGIDRRILASLA